MPNQSLYQVLISTLGDRCSRNPTILEHHSHDESWHPPQTPALVCFPENCQEICLIVQNCQRYNTPITPFGAGTSVEGQSIPVNNGVCLDLTGMNRILEINPQDLTCRVEAGVTRKQLNEALKIYGLFFPVDPGADATIGGMCATRASGTNAVRYGTMKENVLSLKAVDADGNMFETGTSAKKSAAGLDLTSLLIGSEGTLAIITEITLRLYGIPQQIAAARLCFDDLGNATEFVTQVLQCGLPLARIELLDDVQINAVNRYKSLELPETHTLFIEFQGTHASVEEQTQQAKEIAAALTPHPFQWSVKQEEKNQLWEARHHALYAAKQLQANARVWTTDVCVPLSRLSECLLATKQDLEETGLTAPIVGHVGDGNFHLLMLLPEGDGSAIKRAEMVNQRMIQRAIACGGTCTGEHGIGLGKQLALEQQHPDTLTLMRKIKTALDPNNLFNPGKLYGRGENIP